MRKKLGLLPLILLALSSCKYIIGSAIDAPKPDNMKAAETNVNLGLGYLEQGQLPRAKNKFLKAISLAPKKAMSHAALAYFYEKVGDYSEAEKEYKASLYYANKNEMGALHNNYGAFLCRQGNYLAADKQFEVALNDKSYIRTAEIYENAGICALKWQKTAKAEDYLTTAVLRDGTREKALLELADLSWQRHDYTKADKYLQQYKKYGSNSPRSLWLEIRVSESLANWDAVASQGLLLKNLFPDSTEYTLYQKSQQNN